jgi:hypothetical protein
VSVQQTLHFSPVAGALVLLLAGCGAQATSHGPTATSARTSPDTEPSTEGSGPESPLQPSGGGVSLSVPTLPIGDGGSTPTNEDVCIDVKWLGLGMLPPMVTLTVTDIVIDGPFRTVGLAAAGCTGDDGPPCVGLRLTATDNAGVTCAAGVAWTGGRPTKAPSVELAGELSCPHLDSAACQQIRNDLEAKARASRPVNFEYNLPAATGSSSATGPSSPPATDTSSPSPSGTSSPSSPGTSSSSSPGTSSP